jgi:hypothetical protein
MKSEEATRRGGDWETKREEERGRRGERRSKK